MLLRAPVAICRLPRSTRRIISRDMIAPSSSANATISAFLCAECSDGIPQERRGAVSAEASPPLIDAITSPTIIYRGYAATATATSKNEPQSSPTISNSSGGGSGVAGASSSTAHPSASLAVCTYTVEHLASVRPSLWPSLLENYLHVGRHSSASTWGSVWHAVTAHAYLRGTPQEMEEAHAGIRYVLSIFYKRDQPEGTRDSSCAGSLPQTVLLKWKELYHNQYALLQFAELFEDFVRGEESLLLGVAERHTDDNNTNTMPMQPSPAALQCAELWEYYISIPGRREAGLHGSAQWSRELATVRFAFPRLFAQYASDGSQLKKFTTMCMNVCMWCRNDNNEGARCREAIHAILEGYFAARNHNQTLVVGILRSSWEAVELVRSTALEVMDRKAERLHYACSPGMFDVYTLAATLEPFRSKDSGNEATSRDISILLHPLKPTPARVWEGLQTHTEAGRMASRYAVLSLGSRLARSIVTKFMGQHGNQAAAMSHSLAARLVKELREWTAAMGAPLQISSEAESLWKQHITLKLLQSSSNNHVSFETNWRLLFEDRKGHYVHWHCGCGMANYSQTETTATAVSCAACVGSSLVPHSWQCSSCQHVNTCGSPCLSCGSAHPAAVNNDTNNSMFDSSVETPMVEVLYASERYDDHSGGEGQPLLTTSYAVKGTYSYDYVRSHFQWRCGCGAANSATHTHCKQCSSEQQQAVFTCSSCHSLSRATDNGDSRQGCTHCHESHPIEAAAQQARVLTCPTCRGRVCVGNDADAEECPSCHSTAIRLMRPFVQTEGDAPWRCHCCGGSNHIRDDSTGVLHERRANADACTHCHTARSVCTSNVDYEWCCMQCGSATQTGFACTKCHALCPSIPPAEAQLWRCGVCEDTLNYSWQSVCSLPGCGSRQKDAAAEKFSYTPWACGTCGQANRTKDRPLCIGCGTSCCDGHDATHTDLADLDDKNGSRDQQTATAASANVVMPMDLQRQLDAVHTLLLKAAAAPPASTTHHQDVLSQSFNGEEEVTLSPAGWVEAGGGNGGLLDVSPCWEAAYASVMTRY